MTVDSPDTYAWYPTSSYLEDNRLLQLIERTGSKDFDDLLARAGADPAWYWEQAVADLGLAWQKQWTTTLDLSLGIAWPRWFAGAEFNYVASALDRHADGPRAHHPAIIWEGDDDSTTTLTFAELAELTDRCAHALRAFGVGRGDAVGIFLPMIPEVVAATLACSKLGAVFVPLFSGFGEESIVSRLGDCKAKVLITADGFFRRGKLVPMKAVADAALERLPNIEHCLVVRRTGEEITWQEGRDLWWDEAIAVAECTRLTELTAADDPYMILYTSGTTGKPKGAVHVHAGFPIKAAHDLAYAFDLHEEDVLFWLTDIGWMMGPWLIAGGLMLGSTIVLFEGTPDYPGPDRLWKIVERHKVSVVGVAPTAIRALIPHGEDVVRATDRSSLRILGSTGETWNPDPWRWYLDVVGDGRCPIVNYSGGTETSGGIIASLPIFPIKPCGFSGPIPGMAADVVDVEHGGAPIRNGVGELVIRQPWVGMTRGFWQDPERYEATYWERLPGVWVHGDFAEIDADGEWFIRGRSDDTLKISGKRIGPAEIESSAVAQGSVKEAAAIGVPHAIKGDVAIVFAVPRPDVVATAELAEEVRLFIGKQLGAALRPEHVVFVNDLPKTRNAKIMRRVIRATWLGLPAGDITALENPAAVEAIRLAVGTLAPS